jgi:hypothetical protein
MPKVNDPGWIIVLALLVVLAYALLKVTGWGAW